MANIELIIEKLESLGFVEVVLSTKEIFWQKANIKVSLEQHRIVVKQERPEEKPLELFFSQDYFTISNLENISQW